MLKNIFIASNVVVAVSAVDLPGNNIEEWYPTNDNEARFTRVRDVKVAGRNYSALPATAIKFTRTMGLDNGIMNEMFESSDELRIPVSKTRSCFLGEWCAGLKQNRDGVLVFDLRNVDRNGVRASWISKTGNHIIQNRRTKNDPREDPLTFAHLDLDDMLGLQAASEPFSVTLKQNDDYYFNKNGKLKENIQCSFDNDTQRLELAQNVIQHLGRWIGSRDATNGSPVARSTVASTTGVTAAAAASPTSTTGVAVDGAASPTSTTFVTAADVPASGSPPARPTLETPPLRASPRATAARRQGSLSPSGSEDFTDSDDGSSGASESSAYDASDSSETSAVDDEFLDKDAAQVIEDIPSFRIDRFSTDDPSFMTEDSPFMQECQQTVWMKFDTFVRTEEKVMLAVGEDCAKSVDREFKLDIVQKIFARIFEKLDHRKLNSTAKKQEWAQEAAAKLRMSHRATIESFIQRCEETYVAKVNAEQKREDDALENFANNALERAIDDLKKESTGRERMLIFGQELYERGIDLAHWVGDAQRKFVLFLKGLKFQNVPNQQAFNALCRAHSKQVKEMQKSSEDETVEAYKKSLIRTWNRSFLKERLVEDIVTKFFYGEPNARLAEVKKMYEDAISANERDEARVLGAERQLYLTYCKRAEKHALDEFTHTKTASEIGKQAYQLRLGSIEEMITLAKYKLEKIALNYFDEVAYTGSKAFVGEKVEDWGKQVIKERVAKTIAEKLVKRGNNVAGRDTTSFKDIEDSLIKGYVKPAVRDAETYCFDKAREFVESNDGYHLNEIQEKTKGRREIENIEKIVRAIFVRVVEEGIKDHDKQWLHNGDFKYPHFKQQILEKMFGARSAVRAANGDVIIDESILNKWARSITRKRTDDFMALYEESKKLSTASRFRGSHRASHAQRAAESAFQRNMVEPAPREAVDPLHSTRDVPAPRRIDFTLPHTKESTVSRTVTGHASAACANPQQCDAIPVVAATVQPSLPRHAASTGSSRS